MSGTYKVGDHVKVLGVVYIDGGDSVVGVKFSQYGQTSYIDRGLIEFLHGNFEVGDAVVYKHAVLGDVPGNVLAITGTEEAWVRLIGGSSDVIAKFAELTAAVLAEEPEEEEAPASQPGPAAAVEEVGDDHGKIELAERAK